MKYSIDVKFGRHSCTSEFDFTPKHRWQNDALGAFESEACNTAYLGNCQAIEQTLQNQAGRGELPKGYTTSDKKLVITVEPMGEEE